MDLPVNYNNIDRAERRLVRLEYIKQQKELCCHCNEPLIGVPSNEVEAMQIDISLFPDGFFNWPVHLHHSHETGMTIGAVHAKCNAVLWQYFGE